MIYRKHICIDAPVGPCTYYNISMKLPGGGFTEYRTLISAAEASRLRFPRQVIADRLREGRRQLRMSYDILTGRQRR